MYPSKYQPIDCNLYDKYLDFTTRKVTVKVCYLDEGKSFESIGTIQDVFTKNKEEFLFLSNGLKLRLDQVISCLPASG